MTGISKLKVLWINIFYIFFAIVAFYVFNEWLFYVTKVSFISSMDLIGKIRICFSAISLLTVFFGIFLFILFLLSNIKYVRFASIFIGLLFLTLLALLSLILLFDNFTYITMNFGIVSSKGIFKLIYLIFFLNVSRYIYRKIFTFVGKIHNNIRFKNELSYILGCILVLFTSIEINNTNLSLNLLNKDNYPNIIFITADGLNANHMSIYGYSRKTTPNIDKLASSSLLIKNFFSNSANTTGSIISMYTSKYPTSLRLIYTPDILTGIDSYQHFPGILKKMGFFNVQYTYSPYADAYSANLLSGFDYANGKYMKENSIFLLLNKFFYSELSYFVYELESRIVNRIYHLFFIRDMIDNRDLIEGEINNIDDWNKISNMLVTIREHDEPVFAHIHWMGTHGSKFFPDERPFSLLKNMDNQDKWDEDFYDDSIYEFDKSVGKIIEELKNIGEFDNTVILITSDHGMKYSTIDRIPLIIHFPYNAYSGVRNSNIQTIDISPTILEYLRFNKPTWMKGDSILSGDFDNRAIYAAGVGNVLIEEGKVVKESMKPPFFQFGYINLIYCNRWFRISLTKSVLSSGSIELKDNTCNENILSAKNAFELIKSRLKLDGFDVSSLSNIETN
jgi:hypothetical protein